MRVKVKRLDLDVNLPFYATPGAAGFDFVAIESVAVRPWSTVLIKTGLAFEIPEGHEIQVRPRSGLSFKTPLRVANAPGTLDEDFRGEVCVIITNQSDETVEINKGDRIAQGVLCPVVKADFVFASELSETARAGGGFGSTGK